ncbi:MAG: hypothetical protein U9R44_06795 [Candidatus Omnitrophota bacterium]|nr:hypothetical protein [Candidatus Omnitrophota bacterium]
MIGLFLVSVVAGMILGAPFGPAGALVADAALVHDRERLNLTVLAVVAGNGILAFIISLGAGPVQKIFEKHESLFFLIAGVAFIIMGLFLGIITALSRARGLSGREVRFASKGAIGQIAHSLSVFFITLLHPGSIAALLLLTALLSLKFYTFSDHKIFFAAGIAVGSFFVFSPVGLLFWAIGKKADRFIAHFRYGLAAVFGFAGIYFLVRSY